VTIPAEVKCLRCQNVMANLGQVSLVTGGHSAGAKLLFGQFAEMNEKPWPVDVYACSECLHVELFYVKSDK